MAVTRPEDRATLGSDPSAGSGDRADGAGLLRRPWLSLSQVRNGFGQGLRPFGRLGPRKKESNLRSSDDHVAVAPVFVASSVKNWPDLSPMASAERTFHPKRGHNGGMCGVRGSDAAG